MELSRQINELVARFVEQVAALAGELAHAQLAGALGAEPPARGGDHGRSARPTTARAGRAGATTGARRTAGEIERLRARLLAHVEAHPGQRIEQIKVALEATTRQLAVPLQKLIFADLVRSEGERRATRYFPAATSVAAAVKAAGPRRATTRGKVARAKVTARTPKAAAAPQTAAAPAEGIEPGAGGDDATTTASAAG